MENPGRLYKALWRAGPGSLLFCLCEQAI